MGRPQWELWSRVWVCLGKDVLALVRVVKGGSRPQGVKTLSSCGKADKVVLLLSIFLLSGREAETVTCQVKCPSNTAEQNTVSR